MDELQVVEYPMLSKGIFLDAGEQFYIARPVEHLKKWVMDGPFKKNEKQFLRPCASAPNTGQSFMALEPSPNLFSQGIRAQIGSDPEVFAADSNGKLISAVSWAPAQRTENITRDRTQRPTGRLFRDGVAGEFYTYPYSCIAAFVDELACGLQEAEWRLKSVHPSARLTMKNVFELSPRELDELSDTEVELGCSPSLSAYGDPPLGLNGRYVPIRSAGGHIHFGHTPNGTREDIFLKATKFLDFYLGVPCVSLAEKIDSPSRRQFYGRAGEYRIQKHGLEYRTLSNFWLCHPAIAQLVLEMGRAGFDFGVSSPLMLLPFGAIEEARDVINATDVTGARKMLKKYEKHYMKLLEQCFTGIYVATAISPDSRTRPKAFELLMNGVHSRVTLDDSLAAHWNLDTWIYHSERPGAQFASFVSGKT